MEIFNGYKSYIGAIAIAVIGILEAAGVLDASLAATLKTISAGVFGVGIAHKLAKAAG